MIYVRAMLAWLLPTLGLAAAEECGFKPISLFPAQGVCAVLSASNAGTHGRGLDARGMEPSLRVQSRRFSTYFGPGSAPVFAARSEGTVPALCHELFIPGNSAAAIHLAQSWQFAWRTAPEPRAPSFVS